MHACLQFRRHEAEREARLAKELEELLIALQLEQQPVNRFIKALSQVVGSLPEKVQQWISDESHNSFTFCFDPLDKDLDVSVDGNKVYVTENDNFNCDGWYEFREVLLSPHTAASDELFQLLNAALKGSRSFTQTCGRLSWCQTTPETATSICRLAQLPQRSDEEWSTLASLLQDNIAATVLLCVALQFRALADQPIPWDRIHDAKDPFNRVRM